MNTFCVMIVFCLVQFSGASESGVVGGKTAVPHSRKYMASLQAYYGHFCGGFLIRDDFVLTAAHCESELPTTVVLGAHNISQKEPSQQRIDVEKYYPHPKYTGKHDYDIMLLKLKHKAKLNSKVQTIDPPKKLKKTKALQKCSVAGWGKTDPSEHGPVSNVLRVAEEETQFDFECMHIWKEHFNPSHMICTKFNKKKGGSICQGDSGGPLICNNKPLGIVAFTYLYDCSNSTYYHVYTKISSFLPWIKEVMSGL